MATIETGLAVDLIALARAGQAVLGRNPNAEDHPAIQALLEDAAVRREIKARKAEAKVRRAILGWM